MIQVKGRRRSNLIKTMEKGQAAEDERNRLRSEKLRRESKIGQLAETWKNKLYKALPEEYRGDPLSVNVVYNLQIWAVDQATNSNSSPDFIFSSLLQEPLEWLESGVRPNTAWRRIKKRNQID